MCANTVGANAIGDLMYWVDSIPRKINLTKANICNRQKSYFFTAGQYNPFAGGGNFLIQVFDNANNSLFNNGISFGNYNNSTDAFAFIADHINSNFSAQLLATACNCGMTLTMLQPTAFYLSS
jgi:hypothetical protein